MKNLTKVSRYELETEVGRGSMGIVYQARDPRIDRLVALKVVDLSSAWIEEGSASAGEEFRERFIREARIAGKLSHPSIVIIHDAGEEGELCFIAMEYVPGPSLKRFSRGKYSFSLAQILRIIRKAASALDYAHSTGVIHRDVKPGNILISPNSEAPVPPASGVEVEWNNEDFGLDFAVKLVDFGIARFEGSELTREGLVIGSPSYMSPEQIRGKRVDGRSDQFSLGVVAYELITSQKPFSGDDIKAIGYQIINEDPTPPNRVRPELPAFWNEVFSRVLAKDPADRYPSVIEFARALHAQAPETRPSPPGRDARSPDPEPELSEPGPLHSPDSSRPFDPDSSPPWAESSIVHSIIHSKTMEARGWPIPGRGRLSNLSRVWIWYLLILIFLGGIIFTLIKW